MGDGMSIQVGWVNEQQNTVHIAFQRGWRWDHLNAAIQRADDLITSVPHTVHLLIDIRQAGGLPGDFITRAGDLFAQGKARPNEGRKVVIGASPLIRAGYSAFLKVYGSQMKNRAFLFASTLEDASRLLNGASH
jgi:hypothetical protein